jgi:PIN domain nuclease of toxin-antitoxin system
MLLLDTCALLMLAGRREDIPDKVMKKLAAQADELFVPSAVSISGGTAIVSMRNW